MNIIYLLNVLSPNNIITKCVYYNYIFTFWDIGSSELLFKKSFYFLFLYFINLVNFSFFFYWLSLWSSTHLLPNDGLLGAWEGLFELLFWKKSDQRNQQKIAIRKEKNKIKKWPTFLFFYFILFYFSSFLQLLLHPNSFFFSFSSFSLFLSIIHQLNQSINQSVITVTFPSFLVRFIYPFCSCLGELFND